MTLPCNGWNVSSAVTDGSELGKTAKAQRAATVTVSATRRASAPAARPSRRSHRRRGCFARGIPVDYTARAVPPSLFAPVDEQLAVIRRGTADIIVEAELRTKLARGHALRVKLGLDPTAPDLHLGHTVGLRKLRDFQELGHEI